MHGVVLTGHGGPEKLVYREDLEVPRPDPSEVLIRVSAAGINNTDINTRIGWYSKSVKTGTESSYDSQTARTNEEDDDATWSGNPMQFPRIQGADCCGRIVVVGSDVSSDRIGERVLVRNMLRHYVGYRPFECWTFGSEVDGGFAQYAKAPAREVFKVDCNWSDEALGAVPCAYSTAEGMLHRAGLNAGDSVVITGASGGVGTAAIQLAKRRKANVFAVCRQDKADQIRAFGADHIIPRGQSVVEAIGKERIDLVIDLVAGPTFPESLDVLKKGGRYAVAGAIAGPLVQLDVRTLYLKDLTFFGCTFQDDEVFSNLVSYIERGEIEPPAVKAYPLRDISVAQEDFLSKDWPGKLVLQVQ